MNESNLICLEAVKLRSWRGGGVHTHSLLCRTFYNTLGGTRRRRVQAGRHGGESTNTVLNSLLALSVLLDEFVDR